MELILASGGSPGNGTVILQQPKCYLWDAEGEVALLSEAVYDMLQRNRPHPGRGSEIIPADAKESRSGIFFQKRFEKVQVATFDVTLAPSHHTFGVEPQAKAIEIVRIVEQDIFDELASLLPCHVLLTSEITEDLNECMLSVLNF